MPTTINSGAEAERVGRYSRPEMLADIQKQIERNVAYYASQTGEVIAERIEELNREWSIERCLQANIAGVGLVGGVLGLAGRKKWALLVLGAFGILLHHALQGWDTPIPFLRRLGLRSRKEIDQEIYALRVARGDFKDMSAERLELKPVPTKQIIQAVKA